MPSEYQLPGTTRAYDDRWAALAASGIDPHGEVAFVQRFGPQRVLDAGCGTGRIAIELDRRGVSVVGVDVDADMLDAARAKAPHLTWVEADLATFDVGESGYDVVVAAGNVMIFAQPVDEVVARCCAHVASGGVLIAGFQLGPRVSVTLAEYDEWCLASGLQLVERHATWDGAPGDLSSYAVSVHRRSSVAF